MGSRVDTASETRERARIVFLFLNVTHTAVCMNERTGLVWLPFGGRERGLGWPLRVCRLLFPPPVCRRHFLSFPSRVKGEGNRGQAAVWGGGKREGAGGRGTRKRNEPQQERTPRQFVSFSCACFAFVLTYYLQPHALPWRLPAAAAANPTRSSGKKKRPLHRPAQGHPQQGEPGPVPLVAAGAGLAVCGPGLLEVRHVKVQQRVLPHVGEAVDEAVVVGGGGFVGGLGGRGHGGGRGEAQEGRGRRGCGAGELLVCVVVGWMSGVLGWACVRCGGCVPLFMHACTKSPRPQRRTYNGRREERGAREQQPRRCRGGGGGLIQQVDDCRGPRLAARWGVVGSVGVVLDPGAEQGVEGGGGGGAGGVRCGAGEGGEVDPGVVGGCGLGGWMIEWGGWVFLGG